MFVNKPDWATAQTQAAVTEGQTTRVTIELGEPFKVSGIVRDSSGAPVAGASVGVFPDYWSGGAGINIHTDANGHYALSWQKPAAPTILLPIMSDEGTLQRRTAHIQPESVRPKAFPQLLGCIPVRSFTSSIGSSARATTCAAS